MPFANSSIRGSDLTWDRVDVDALDCIAVNVAVLLEWMGVRDIRTPFAAEWHFSFVPEGSEAQLLLGRSSLQDLVARYTRYTIKEHRLSDDGGLSTALARLADEGPILLFGDAYHMPWLPYANKQHMEHSVILTSVDGRNASIVDAYSIRTEWGDARPTATSVPAACLVESISSLKSTRHRTAWSIQKGAENAGQSIDRVLYANVESILQELDATHAMRTFATYYADRVKQPDVLQQFALDCWLVTRARQIHARWLADLAQSSSGTISAAVAEAFENTVVRPWKTASEFSYVAFRRAQGGRSTPDTSFKLIMNQIEPAEIELAKLIRRELLGQSSVTNLGLA
jgi:hypothetical protein